MTLQGHYKLKKVKSYFGKEMEIPEEWKLDQIQNHSRIVTGSKNTQDKVYDGKYPFFVRSQKIARINSYSYDGESVLTVGDGKIGEIFHYINGRFDFHQRVYKISDFKTSLDGHFFYYYFSTYFLNRAKSMTAKNTVDSIRMGMIAEMLIPLPPLPEQQKIASILSNVDALIESTQNVIEKTERLKKGLMQQLLTKVISQKKLKMTKSLFGRYEEIPEKWTVKKINDFATVHGRIGWKNLRADEYVESGPLMLSVWSLIKNILYGIDYNVGTKRLSKFRYDESPEIQLKDEDVLVAKDGDIGRIGFVKKLPEHSTVNSHVVIVRIKNKQMHPEYLYHYMKFHPFQAYCKSYTSGTTVPLLTQKDLRNALIVSPQIKEQQKIASILSGVDATNYTHIIINTSLCIRLRIILILFTTILYHEFYNTEKDIHNSHNT